MGDYLIPDAEIAAKFLMPGNLIDRGGHLMRVIHAARRDDRVDFVLADLDDGNRRILANIHGEVEVEQYIEVSEQEYNAAIGRH